MTETHTIVGNTLVRQGEAESAVIAVDSVPFREFETKALVEHVPISEPLESISSRTDFRLFQARELAQHILSKFYGFENIVSVQENNLGCVNSSFEVIVRRSTEHDAPEERFFLRRYNSSRTVSAVQHEHQVVEAVNERSPGLTASLIKTVEGKSLANNLAADKHPGLYALFTYIEGEDRYAWTRPPNSVGKNQSGGSILAQFHLATFNRLFSREAIEQPLVDIWPDITSFYEGLSGTLSMPSQVRMFLNKHLPTIIEISKQIQEAFDRTPLNTIPWLEAHFDFHPGNARWQDKAITGIFDFDWSKYDLRIVDVAMSISYFAKEKIEYLGRENTTNFDLIKLASFLAAYNHKLSSGQSPGSLPPISDVEAQLLPVFIQACNLYVLKWILCEVNDMSNSVDLDDYMLYIEYQMQTIQWLTDTNNQAKLGSAINSAIADEIGTLMRSSRALWTENSF